MTPHASETLGCRIVGEFVDEPESNQADLGGKGATESEGVGGRILGEFVDQSPGDDSATKKSVALAHDVETRVASTALFDRAVSIYEQLVQEGRSHLASELARARTNKAIAIRELGEGRAAVALVDQTIALYERLVEQERRHELAHDLTTTYDHKATTLRQAGDLCAAVVLYDRAIATLERLVHHEGRQELADDLTWTQQQKNLALSTIPPERNAQPLPWEPLTFEDVPDPFAPIRRLLLEADSGDESLAMLRGCTLVRELGAGGMGAVALIRRSATPEVSGLFALKVMRPERTADPKANETFEREIEIGKALSHTHPNIVRMLFWGLWQGIYFFATEYCDSGDLHQFVQQHGGKLSPEQARPIIFQTLDALDFAHKTKVRARLSNGSFVEACGVVHRDVKPSNIFLCGSGEHSAVKLGDFGLAKAFATAGLSGVTEAGAIGGTYQFMPQQLRKDFFRLAQPEFDVWSAAAALYYMLTGQPPRDFANYPPEKWLWVVKTKSPVPIRERDASIPPALADVIDHALDDRDGLNFQAAAALKQALESVL